MRTTVMHISKNILKAATDYGDWMKGILMEAATNWGAWL